MDLDAGKIIDIKDLGEIDYATALVLQEAKLQKVANGVEDPALLVCQHPSVITVGKNYKSLGHEIPHTPWQVIESDRGGLATGHELGQLVAYPILPIGDMGLSVKTLVWNLEKTVIELLDDFGIDAKRDPRYPGVWVGNKKICSLGIRIKKRTSMHGLALNVSNSLEIFNEIIPCGMSDRQMTSMKQILGAKLDFNKVKFEFMLKFVTHFGLSGARYYS